MKKQRFAFIALMIAITSFVMTSCDTESTFLGEPQLSTPAKSITTSSGGSSVPLYAGQSINVGSVLFDDVDTDNDGSDDALQITYSLTGGWELVEIHYWMGETLSEMPANKNGSPKIGQFPYSYDNLNGATSYSFLVPFSSINYTCSSEGVYFITSHASVRLSTGSGTYQTETAWGDGQRLLQKGNWSMYFTIDIDCDNNNGGNNTLNTETAFAYNSTSATCFSAYDFSRWGWTNGSFSYGSYSFDIYAGAGQCDLTKGTKVGTLSLNYSSNGSATVTYTMTSPYKLEEVHLYVGNDVLPSNNSEYTVAPGQYPNIDGNLSSATTYTFNVTGLSGSVYLVAHATVSGF